MRSVSLLSMLLLLWLAGQPSPASASCDLLDADLEGVLQSPEILEFSQRLSSQSKASIAQLTDFLNREGVNAKLTDFRGHKILLLKVEGDHPLNKLARIYALDNVEIGFSPGYSGARSAAGVFSSTSKVVILEANVADRVDGTTVFTVTDLHELLHARIDRDAQGMYLETKVVDAKAFSADLVSFNYGSNLVLSELLTSRQDLRILLGKMVLWHREQVKKPSFFRGWLDYLLKGRKRQIKSRERVDKILAAATSKKTLTGIFNNMLEKMVTAISSDVESLLSEERRPTTLEPARTKGKDGDVRSALVYRVPPELLEGTIGPVNPSIWFSITREAEGSWDLAKQQIRQQLVSLRALYERSKPLIDELGDELKTLRNEWRLWTTGSGNLADLGASIGRAHELTRALHNLVYDDLAAYRRLSSGE